MREPRAKPARLDVWLVGQGLAPSREKAQALVMAGRVRVAGVAAAKPGTPVREGAAVEVLPGPQHVGRGAVKLAGALDALGVDPRGRVAVDGLALGIRRLGPVGRAGAEIDHGVEQPGEAHVRRRGAAQHGHQRARDHGRTQRPA